MEQKLFRRVCSVQVDTLLLSNLDVEFRVDRNLDATQNTAEVLVYNLTSDHRKQLQSKKEPVVKLNAGYDRPGLTKTNNAPLSTVDVPADPPLLFLGKLREVTSLRQGADWVTRLSSGDGDEKRTAGVSFSLGPGSSFSAAVKKLYESMKVGAGNLLSQAAKGKFADGANQFIEGIVVHGNSHDEMRRLLGSVGMTYSIQNGAIQVLENGKALGVPAVFLSPATGLIGSPEVGVSNQKDLGPKPMIRFRSLLNSEIYPGRLVTIEAEVVKTTVRADRVVYLGQTAGQEWYCDVEGTPLV